VITLLVNGALVTKACRILRLQMEETVLLNKQSRSDDKGWLSSSGVGLTNPHHKK
jgi:hypothetical protein